MLSVIEGHKDADFFQALIPCDTEHIAPESLPLYCAQDSNDVTYSIVRPTAFFKSLAGQVRLQYSTCLFLYISSCVNPCIHCSLIVG